jgi:hypothetical protein
MQPSIIPVLHRSGFSQGVGRVLPSDCGPSAYLSVVGRCYTSAFDLLHGIECIVRGQYSMGIYGG